MHPERDVTGWLSKKQDKAIAGAALKAVAALGSIGERPEVASKFHGDGGAGGLLRPEERVRLRIFALRIIRHGTVFLCPLRQSLRAELHF